MLTALVVRPSRCRKYTMSSPYAWSCCSKCDGKSEPLSTTIPHCPAGRKSLVATIAGEWISTLQQVRVSCRTEYPASADLNGCQTPLHSSMLNSAHLVPPTDDVSSVMASPPSSRTSNWSIMNIPFTLSAVPRFYSRDSHLPKVVTLPRPGNIEALGGIISPVLAALYGDARHSADRPFHSDIARLIQSS